MKIRLGFDMVFGCTQPTPVILTLNVHSSRAEALLQPDQIITDPKMPLTGYHDLFGNWITRLMLAPGDTRISNNTIIDDTGEPDEIAPQAQQIPVQNLPDSTLVYLLGSRYCETDLLSNEAWRLFGNSPPGWQRVQAICDFVHNHIMFGYEYARNTKTAAQALEEKVGVCRDYTHLAVAFCRCMNIPARYCTGYLSDIGQPPPYGEMDFAAWFEAYLDGRWYTFDPRNNKRYIGRVLMARGRDAADVSLSNSFGETLLKSFKVFADEVTGG